MPRSHAGRCRARDREGRLAGAWQHGDEPPGLGASRWLRTAVALDEALASVTSHPAALLAPAEERDGGGRQHYRHHRVPRQPVAARVAATVESTTSASTWRRRRSAELAAEARIGLGGGLPTAVTHEPLSAVPHQRREPSRHRHVPDLDLSPGAPNGSCGRTPSTAATPRSAHRHHQPLRRVLHHLQHPSPRRCSRTGIALRGWHGVFLFGRVVGPRPVKGPVATNWWIPRLPHVSAAIEPLTTRFRVEGLTTSTGWH